MPAMVRIDWYHRDGVDPWQLAACERHGQELAALGFAPGVADRFRKTLGKPPGCPFCDGATSIDEVRACRCHLVGDRCPVHAPQPAGAPGELVSVACGKCGAHIALPAERVAFVDYQLGPDIADTAVIAVDVTGWAERQGDGPELRCPFHGSQVYFLERVDDADVHGAAH